MKTLTSFAALARELEKNTLGALVASQAALGRAAKVVQRDAQARIGHYQGEVGQFQDWAPLAESTEEEKARLGYPLDAPLLRDGELRDSIKTEVYPHEAVIGSKLKKAAYQEFGTPTIPPRPFLGPAAFGNQKRIVAILGTAVVGGLTGGMPIHSSLGYDGSME